MKTRHGKNTLGRSYTNLRDRFKKARKALKLTQRELSKRMRRDKNFVQRFEAGDSTLDIVEFKRYAKALRLDPGEVINEI